MSARPWSAIVLAGGDGTRLRAWARAILGEDRPKQFCRIVGEQTLLGQTRRRAALVAPPGRILTVVTRAHERHYAIELDGVAPETVVVQPSNRGTAAAIAYAVLRLEAAGLAEPVAIMPSDHYVSSDHAFMARVECALEAARAEPDRLVLLGIAPDRPEPEYGWIEAGALVAGPSPWPVYAVRRFIEKPSREVAERLARQGCLWNSFVMAARPAALRALLRASVPGLLDLLGPLAAAVGTPGEGDAARMAYARLPPLDFSRHVLQAQSHALALLPVTGVEWSDLGDPERVMATRRQLRWEPALA